MKLLFHVTGLSIDPTTVLHAGYHLFYPYMHMNAISSLSISHTDSLYKFEYFMIRNLACCSPVY